MQDGRRWLRRRIEGGREDRGRERMEREGGMEGPNPEVVRWREDRGEGWGEGGREQKRREVKRLRFDEDI